MAAVGVKEINSVRAFFRSRTTSNTTSDATLQKSFTDTLLRIINNMKPFGPNEGSQLNEALKDAPYGDVQTQRIVDHIDAKMQIGHSSRATALAAQSDKCKQFLKHWWNYPTNDEWVLLKDRKNSFNLKTTTIVERGMSFGCVDPDEQALKWALATLVHVHYDELPSAQQLYQKLQDLKQAFVAEKHVFPHEHIQEFPESATDLPDHIYKYAYPDSSGPPVSVVLFGINTVAECIPLRKNSKLLRAKSSDRHDANKRFAECKKGIIPKDEPCSHARVIVKAEIDDTQHNASNELIHVRDDDEQKLLNEYREKLAALRQLKNQPADVPLKCEPPPSPSPSPAHGTLSVRRTEDGSLRLTPRCYDRALDPTPREQPSSQPSMKTENQKDQQFGLDDLDPFTQAAIHSLQVRDKKKKDNIAAKRKATPAIKRPAANAAAEQPRAKVAKAEKAQGCRLTKFKTEKVEVSKANIHKSMPSQMPKDGSNPAPVIYKQGVIYTSRREKKFRALVTRGDKWSEKAAMWKADKPSKKAWATVVKAIEEGKKWD